MEAHEADSSEMLGRADLCVSTVGILDMKRAGLDSYKLPGLVTPGVTEASILGPPPSTSSVRSDCEAILFRNHLSEAVAIHAAAVPTWNCRIRFE